MVVDFSEINDQVPGRYDQDLRFGSESLKALFFVVKLLEDECPDLFLGEHRTRPADLGGEWGRPGPRPCLCHLSLLVPAPLPTGAQPAHTGGLRAILPRQQVATGCHSRPGMPTMSP